MISFPQMKRVPRDSLSAAPASREIVHRPYDPLCRALVLYSFMRWQR